MAGAGLTREARLAAYLRRAAATPVVWGSTDCTLGFAAGWVLQERGLDLAAPWRGTYSSALGAARLLRANGDLLTGLPVLVGRACESAGLEPTGCPRTGDVAVVWLQGRRRRVQAMAVRSVARWAFLSPHGVGFGPADLIKAWEV